MRRNGRLRRAKWLRLTGGSCNHDAEARTKHQHAGKRSGGREDHRSADKGANGCADLYVAPIASDKHAGSGDSHPRGAPDRHTRSGDDCANRASALAHDPAIAGVNGTVRTYTGAGYRPKPRDPTADG